MANAVFNSLPRDLQKSLYCCICREKFKVPKVIECGHIFCLACLEDLIKNRRHNYPPCPLCRKPIKANLGQPAAYQTQSFYEDLINGITPNVSNQENNSCRSCQSSASQRDVEACLICSEKFCQNCFEEHTSSHGESLASEIIRGKLTSRITKCNIHRNEKVQNFCEDCKETICSQCTEIDHSDHEVKRLEDAVLSFKKSIIDIQTELRDYIDEASEAVDDVRKIRVEFKSSVEQTKFQVKSQVQKLIDYLTKKKAEVLEEIDYHEKSVEKRLEMEADNVQTKNVRAKSMQDFADNVMKYGTDAEIANLTDGISESWENLKTEAIRRFGTGFRVEVKFSVRESLLEMVSRDIGTLKVSQALSPWSPRKFIPTDSRLGSVSDFGELEKRVAASRWSLFPQKRTEILSQLVNPTMHLEAYKVCGRTGNVAVAWIAVGDSKSPLTKRLSRSTSVSSTALIYFFDEKGEKLGESSVEKIPETTNVRIAIKDEEHYLVAFSPGDCAQAFLEQKKKKSVTKRSEFRSIYVAVFDCSGFRSGESRDLPMSAGKEPFMFDITSQSDIVFAQTYQYPQEITIFPESAEMKKFKYSSSRIQCLKESLMHEIVIFGEDNGNIVVESCSHEGQLQGPLKISTDASPLIPLVFKDASFDRSGNILIHVVINSKDVLYLVPALDRGRKEQLSKPEMFHRVDMMKVLPDGRVCIYDKAECVFMTLRYLCGDVLRQGE